MTIMSRTRWQWRSVHLPMPFVRHYVRRHDGALPTIIRCTTMPLVQGTGRCWLLPALIAHPVHHSGCAARPSPEAGGLHARARRGRDQVPVRRVAGRRRHRQMRQGHTCCACALHHRALAVGQPPLLLCHRRPARQRQDHGDPDADHGRSGRPAGGLGVVFQRGAARRLTTSSTAPYILWDNIRR